MDERTLGEGLSGVRRARTLCPHLRFLTRSLGSRLPPHARWLRRIGDVVRWLLEWRFWPSGSHQTRRSSLRHILMVNALFHAATTGRIDNVRPTTDFLL